MGQEYDHVFDVDFKDGAPKLKLPYNNGQNAYEAAQKFLFANELPLEYTEQVVEFIDKNVGGVTLGGSSDYVDPYTGASRYTGGGVPTSGGPSQGFSGDPFTGEFEAAGLPDFAQRPLTTSLRRRRTHDSHSAQDPSSRALPRSRLRDLTLTCYSSIAILPQLHFRQPSRPPKQARSAQRSAHLRLGHFLSRSFRHRDHLARQPRCLPSHLHRYTRQGFAVT